MNKLLFLIIITVLFSCKTSEKQVKTESSANDSATKFRGIVSHKYKNEGCKTIIIVENNKESKQLILIPLKGFDEKFDKDNFKIKFDYLPLRIKNPEGCNIGIPAAISNIAAD